MLEAAVDDSVVLAWPSGTWPRLVEKFPALAANTLQTVGARLQETHTRVVEMSTEQVEQRIAHALLRLVKQSGRKVENGIEIDFPISRQDVAEMTGTTLHTVSRILSAWEQQGLVEGGRQRIVLRDAHRLHGLAEGEEGIGVEFKARDAGGTRGKGSEQRPERTQRRRRAFAHPTDERGERPADHADPESLPRTPGCCGCWRPGTRRWTGRSRQRRTARQAAHPVHGAPPRHTR